jgi:AAA+ superfamily predicted ATPase
VVLWLLKRHGTLIFDLATAAFVGRREDALFLGPGGTGKSHLAQAIGQAAIQQGYRVLYRETHVLLDELADAVADGTRKDYMESVATVPLLIIDDFSARGYSIYRLLRCKVRALSARQEEVLLEALGSGATPEEAMMKAEIDPNVVDAGLLARIARTIGMALGEISKRV